MKKILLISVLLITSTINAQFGIETETIRGDGAMDFPSPATKGILLPLVNNTNSIPPVGGAIAFNLATQQVEYYDAGENIWLAFSVKLSDNVTVSGPEHAGETGRFDNLVEAEGAIVEAGDVSSTPPVGVLSIESDNKAFILPQVDDATLLPSPLAGMICYDMNSDSIAVFNGEVWSFFN